jgi:hypothetical protein
MSHRNTPSPAAGRVRVVLAAVAAGLVLGGYLVGFQTAAKASGAGAVANSRLGHRQRRSTVAIGIAAGLRDRSGVDLTRTARRLVKAHITYVREDFCWSTIERSPGVLDWRATDRWVGVAARAGIKIIAIPDAPPRWVSARWSVAPATGTALVEYAQFVRAILSRYGSAGIFWRIHPSIPKSPIRMIDVWNEPYIAQFWTGRSIDPGLYAHMFEYVARHARSADPAAKFMIEAEVSWYSGWPQRPFLRAMFNAVPGLRRYIDAVSIHPYALLGPGVCGRRYPGETLAGLERSTRFQVCRIQTIHRDLASLGMLHVPIWITEVGWSTSPSSTSSVSESQRVRYIHGLFSLLRSRWRGEIRGLIWYDLQRTSRVPTAGGEGWFGLLRPDGSATPSWWALCGEAKRGLPR